MLRTWVKTALERGFSGWSGALRFSVSLISKPCLIGVITTSTRSALARAVFFNRLGELRDRFYENQHGRASGLTLLTAAIAYGTPFISNGS